MRAMRVNGSNSWQLKQHLDTVGDPFLLESLLFLGSDLLTCFESLFSLLTLFFSFSYHYMVVSKKLFNILLSL